MLCTFCPSTIWATFLGFCRNRLESSADEMHRACAKKDLTLKKIRTLHFPEKSPTFTNTPCKCQSTCLYNAPRFHTVHTELLEGSDSGSRHAILGATLGECWGIFGATLTSRHLTTWEPSRYRILRSFSQEAAFFAYSWKLPAYSGD